jgi:membrane protease YdiL (CAAX protease family)
LWIELKNREKVDTALPRREVHLAVELQSPDHDPALTLAGGRTNMVVVINRIEPLHGGRKLLLALECGALFIAGPAVGAAGSLPILVIPMLLLMTLCCSLMLYFRYKIRLNDLLRPQVPAREWRKVFVICLIAVPCMIALFWLIKPEAMFSLMRQHTGMWLLIMVLYPFLSAFPQELVYRAFFFERYRPLFGQGYGMILASVSLFSFGHILFHNWTAILLSFVGGWLFARTYQRTSSLYLTTVEHSLYGWAAFTIGYGPFFFDSSMRLYQ